MRRPTWALFAPISVERLKEALESDDRLESCRVLKGNGAYNAIVDDEAGTEHSGEETLARRLSTAGRVYVGYFVDDWVYVFENGKCLEQEERRADSLAHELGCPVLERRSKARR